jgi:hypothetical protein
MTVKHQARLPAAPAMSSTRQRVAALLDFFDC